MRNLGADTVAEAGAGPRAGTWAWLVATFLGAGRLPAAPGTWGSAAAVLLWYVVTRFITPAWQPEAAGALAILAIVTGIPAATSIARQTGRKDPQFVVIDEVAGQLIAFIAAPVSWKTLLTGFILFRIFDTLKPPPLRRLERLPGGIGIVVDDIGAGLYALVILQLALHFGLLSR
ncbi:MAG TPA: phosphatidylglycerophosphatase A [Terriglobales bacterium]|jgi:phosphatidylglycerophosphatase A